MDQHFKAQRVNILTPPLAPSTRVEAAPYRLHALRIWVSAHWEWLLIGAILLIAGLAHGINMFHFPLYEADEGTYMAQAWAILHQGQLAPYTYWYDHAPAGWIQIALWEFLTGGPHTFGGAIRSGRVLMLLYQLGSTFLVYRIGRAISKSAWLATAAALFFALTPYGLYFHRRVLLDNIATFWMLVAILLLLSGRLTLSKVWMSAVALSVSALSKEVTVFVIPAMAYLVFWRTGKPLRRYALVSWITLVFCIGSLYILMAVIKGELFPTGSLLGGSAPHVSLLGSIAYQASRGHDGGIASLTSLFWDQTFIWARDEPTLIIGGTAFALVSVCMMKWRREQGILALLALSLWAFLARGGEDIGFYVIPLLPLLALSLAVNLDLIGLLMVQTIKYVAPMGTKALTSTQSGLFLVTG